MAEKKDSVHTCSICNKEYNTVSERIRCEYNCLNILEAEEAQKKREEEQKQKDNTIKELKEQIRMMKESEESLAREQIAIKNKRFKLQQELNSLINNDLSEFFNRSFLLW